MQMKILIVNPGILPVTLYGGTERVVWYLGKELNKLGHEVTFLTHPLSRCNFGKILPIKEGVDLIQQIPNDVDVVHFNSFPENIGELNKPYIITMHGNCEHDKELDINTVFVSKNHADRYGSDSFVYNGLDWEDYGKVDFSQKRQHFHFLGKAAWRVKNVQGAIDIIKKQNSERLMVLGGQRFNFKMGVRITLHPRIKFAGMVGGKDKFQLLNDSKGLIFPVLWNEPFGLAITESLFFGCPVFGTPYGSLTELVTKDVGYLSNNIEELAKAIGNPGIYSQKHCHEYAREKFNSRIMALDYIKKYEQVASGKTLNNTKPKKTTPEDKFLPWHR